MPHPVLGRLYPEHANPPHSRGPGDT
jgi:hypothetical protein